MIIGSANWESFFRQIKSGIGLDVAKNHTGVVIWNGETVETFGFAIKEYDKTDYFAEYRMRKAFKDELVKIVRGREFEYCIVEDVYGGDNFDTVRKLLALNTVIDELIFEGTCFVDHFVRWTEPVWMKAFRSIYRQKGKLKSKVEVQGILEFLEFPFYMEHKDDENKEDIFFEDICDAAGMLFAVIADKLFQINIAKQSSVKMSDVKMFYVNTIEDTYGIRDKRVESEGFIAVSLEGRNLEKAILLQIQGHPDDVMCAFLPSSKLGVFGTKHKFQFFDSDEGWLVFYKKR